MNDVSRARVSVGRAYHDALAALDPAGLVAGAVDTVVGSRVHVLAVGKAAITMADGARVALGARLAGGLVVTNGVTDHKRASTLEFLVSSHPNPDVSSVAAAHRLLAAVKAVPASDVILFLLSGGASSLCAAPAWGLSLSDKAHAIARLVSGGESIFSINTVRKHLSLIKGGRLAQAARARVHVLVLSDVLDGDLSTVGSGPLFPDATTFADALMITRRHKVPASVTAALQAGVHGDHPETAKLGDACFDNVSHRTLAGPEDLLGFAVRSLKKSGFDVEQGPPQSCTVGALADRLSEAARTMATQVAADGNARALALSGEPTLRLDAANTGHGGRAQHTALCVAVALDEMSLPKDVHVEVLCAGSDGIDGPTDAAGAIVDAGTVVRAGTIDARARLAAFDSYRALDASGDLWRPGPTQNNLCDLYLVAVCKKVRPPW